MTLYKVVWWLHTPICELIFTLYTRTTTITSVLYLTIELDDREDILTIEKKIMCQIFRSSQKTQGKPVRRSKQNETI